MLELLPPQHAIGDESVFVMPKDPAWDLDRIQREKQLLIDAALANNPNVDDKERKKIEAEAIKRHPVERWASASTRYSLAAPLRVPEALRVRAELDHTVEITEYFGAQEPTEFVIRELSAREYARFQPRIASADPLWLFDMAKVGLLEIRNPDIDCERDKHGVAEHVLDALAASDRGLLDVIGAAVSRLTHAPRSAEGKR